LSPFRKPKSMETPELRIGPFPLPYGLCVYSWFFIPQLLTVGGQLLLFATLLLYFFFYFPAPCTFTSNSANFCFRSAWSFPPSASASCVIFIEQNFGPHIEQNFASL